MHRPCNPWKALTRPIDTAIKFETGDLISTTSFGKHEIYPLIVVDNATAEENRLETLLSSAGRLSYTAGTFLRFQWPSFVHLADRSDTAKMQTELTEFSRNVTAILKLNWDRLLRITSDLAHSTTLFYEDNVAQEAFPQPTPETLFATHKFLYESPLLLKDSLWSVQPRAASGPYFLAAKHNHLLVAQALEVYAEIISSFREKINSILYNSSPGSHPNFTENELRLLSVVEAFANQHYINALSPHNEIKALAQDALSGVAFINSQQDARRLLDKLKVPGNSNIVISKPLQNSALRNDTVHYTEPFNVTTDLLVRHDFKDMAVFVIDPPGTVEVDDGMSVERISDTVVKLHIHVADPSAIFGPESETVPRAVVSSLYAPERIVSMLPESIASQSSLNRPGCIALTFSCDFDLTSGNISNVTITDSVIRNIVALNYDQADTLLDTTPQLALLRDVARSHQQFRQSQGFIDLRIPRGRAYLDHATGVVTEVVLDKLDLGSSRQFVSELMIIAGRIAAEIGAERGIYLPYRYHDGPKVPINLSPSATLVEKFACLKHLGSAAIALEPHEHKAMGLTAYCKVTSPIRRYFDLLAHRQLRNKDAYSLQTLSEIIPQAFRHERYLKRLSQACNKFWIEKYLRQLPPGTGPITYTLHIIDVIPGTLKQPLHFYVVHVQEVGTNFTVNLHGNHPEIGQIVLAQLRPESVTETSKPLQFQIK